jgi:HEAT repeat protein
LWIRISKEKEQTIIQRSELGQATLESLLYDLKNTEEAGKRSDTTLYLKFKALVYLHPEKSTTLGVLLISAPPNSLTMRIISEALGNVGHLQAQEALVTAIRARLEEPAAVLKLLKSLGSADLPTRLAEETMRKLATGYPDWNISATATLSLGVMARKLVKTSPERSDRIIQWAISELNSSTTVNRKRLFILVLGNSGVVQALPAITKYVSDPSPGVRSSAASALRLIDSKKADELLTRFLLFDPAEKVRLEAVFAFSLRKFTPTVFDLHKQAFLEDRAEIVRLAALENIWNVHENFPEARRIVKQAADNDPSEEVRKAAKYIMAMYPESYFEE